MRRCLPLLSLLLASGAVAQPTSAATPTPVQTFVAIPAQFKPGERTTGTTVDYVLDTDALVTAQVTATQTWIGPTPAVRTLVGPGTPEPADTQFVHWDGLDQNGKQVPDATYWIYIDALESDGQIHVGGQPVIVNSTLQTVCPLPAPSPTPSPTPVPVTSGTSSAQASGHASSSSGGAPSHHASSASSSSAPSPIAGLSTPDTSAQDQSSSSSAAATVSTSPLAVTTPTTLTAAAAEPRTTYSLDTADPNAPSRLTTDDGQISVSAQPGTTLTMNLAPAVIPSATNGLTLGTTVIELDASVTQFSAPVNISVRPTPSDLAAANGQPQQLTLAMFDPSTLTWAMLPSATLNPDGSITALLSTPGLVAVVAQPQFSAIVSADMPAWSDAGPAAVEFGMVPGSTPVQVPRHQADRYLVLDGSGALFWVDVAGVGPTS